MKFELTDLRKRISDKDLLNDLRSVANNLGKLSLKQRDYCRKNGAKFNLKTAIDRFGNWDSTLKKAGLKGEKSLKGMEYGEGKIREEVLLDDIKRVASDLNKPDITATEYDSLGKYTSTTMNVRFGSWNKAKEKASLVVTRTIGNSNEDLFQNIIELWTLIGRQPKYGEVVAPNSKYNGSTYARRFGSWRSALEAFIEYVNSENDTDKDPPSVPDLVPLEETSGRKSETSKVFKTKKTSRNINLRLRWTILKRDNFCCRKCGRSPAKDPSIVLHVDHIVPWSRSGETVIENLETLCQTCNLGKSNL